MLPWKTPNDPKTLPMGILQDYKSCWTTLGPFGKYNLLTNIILVGGGHWTFLGPFMII